MAAAFTEEIWLTVVVFMFTVVIGYLKKDAVMHLISVAIGLALMIEFLGTNLYLGFAMAILSIYLGYFALFVEWDSKE